MATDRAHSVPGKCQGLKPTHPCSLQLWCSQEFCPETNCCHHHSLSSIVGRQLVTGVTTLMMSLCLCLVIQGTSMTKSLHGRAAFLLVNHDWSLTSSGRTMFESQDLLFISNRIIIFPSYSLLQTQLTSLAFLSHFASYSVMWLTYSPALRHYVSIELLLVRAVCRVEVCKLYCRPSFSRSNKTLRSLILSWIHFAAFLFFDSSNCKYLGLVQPQLLRSPLNPTHYLSFLLCTLSVCYLHCISAHSNVCLLFTLSVCFLHCLSVFYSTLSLHYTVCLFATLSVHCTLL